MVQILLEVWRSSNAYLPLDLRLPAFRLRLYVTDSGAKMVVTDSRKMTDELGSGSTFDIVHPRRCFEGGTELVR